MVIKGNKRGITLIALIITVIIMLILAAITMNLVIGDTGLFARAKEASFKSKMSSIAERWELYLGSYEFNNLENADKTTLYGGEVLKSIIIDEELEIEDSQVQDIKKMIPIVGKEEEQYVIVHEGELYYVSQSKIKNNENQVKWCEEIGIKIWEYVPGNGGIKNTNGDYENVNGIYVCTPKINTGFVKEKTRYIKGVNGNLIPGNWITKKPDADWYDYKNKKWANLYVESNGVESYYVWIPRYVYKVATDGEQRIDAKFVDINNNYKDAQTEKVTTWEELQTQGYQIPEAFYYGDNENYLENTPIPGYWMSKYQLSNLQEDDTYTIDYSTAATPTTITIQNIVLNTEGIEASGKTIAKYTYAINGKIIHESKTPEDYKVTGLARGNKAINVTAIDEKGQIIGSMTKLYEVADVNPPELSGFDPDTTFYVYWDEDKNEHNEIPISQPAPEEWYDYTTARWANIVTRNNGLESYLVWIPRYQYALDTVSKRTYIKFIKGTGSETDLGYQIPEAFYYGDNENYLDNTPITGYWMSKYQLSTAETTPNMTAEISAGKTSIQIKDITGSKIINGLKYEYYLDGKKVHEGTDPLENYKYTNLEGNKIYTVNIIARNRSDNKYIAAITQKVETIGANAPDLRGFNENNTYYVLYKDGKMTVGDRIKKDGSNMPEDWYDYGNRSWANIVTTDGKVENGKIKEATNTSYFVWIPRYQYSLDTVNQRTNVKFVDGISNETDPGYQIPEAFYFGDNENYLENTPITGYWMSKYQLSN